jgi:C4-dicarboxylate transporter DctM subunit
MGGIYTGIFTPTEAAAMAAVYAFIIAVFVYKDLKLKPGGQGAAGFGGDVGHAAVHHHQCRAVLVPDDQRKHPAGDGGVDYRAGLGVVTFLLVVNILLLLAGNVMEPSSIVLIMAPILFPVAMKLGIDPVHFGILIVVNMEVGMCHPPVGLNLYVASGITKMGITELTVAVWPWLLTMLAFLVLVTYVPQISLWLPNLIYS